MAKKVDHQTLSDILGEIREQPAWRDVADREMDYCDGNQLDSALLNQLKSRGVPPAIENMIGPVMEDIAGMEAKNRTDWRVQPDGDDDEEAERVAKALNFKLNQAERRSGADKALTEAYKPLSKVGIGWLEVSRQTDPFKYPYRVQHVHRNEVYWDWHSKEADLSDARWLLRRRWVSMDAAKMLFPQAKALIDSAGAGWGNIDDLSLHLMDGGSSTDLAQSWDIERGWSVEEQEWRDQTRNRCCLFHVFTREWEPAIIMRMENGRVVEVNQDDPLHIAALSYGFQVEKATIGRIYDTVMLGPHVLQTKKSEFSRIPLVGCFGRREDRTAIPYGTVRWMIYLQDELNARISKQQWLLSATRTTRTKGAVNMSDEVFRTEVGRPDADIILDHQHMALAGATFQIETNLVLNRQQYERMLDIREALRKVAGVSEAFSGQAKPENAGAMSQAIEQSVQSLATLNDNFSYARQQVGELLLGMIVRDMGGQVAKVTIGDGLLKEKETIELNSPVTDPVSGAEYRNNDVQRVMLQVVLEDVPSTPSFRQQQLMAMSEAFKSAPPQFQSIMMPHLMHLANVPNKEEIIKAILEINANSAITEEQVEERIKQAVDEAKTKWMVDQKDRELDLKEKRQDAEIRKIIAETVNTAIESIYSGTQAGAQIMSMPGVAAAADQVLNSAGFADQDSAPIVAPPGPIVAPTVTENTSPMFPPRVQDVGPEPMAEEVAPPLESPAEGVNRGIEAPGVQI